MTVPRWKRFTPTKLSITIFYLQLLLYPLIEGSLEVKLPTIWTDEKQSRGEAERRGRLGDKK